jgi:hypothetical protein
MRPAAGSSANSSTRKNTASESSKLAERSQSENPTETPTDASKKSDLYSPSASRNTDHLESRSTNVYSEEFTTISGLEKESSGSALLGLPAASNETDVNVNQFFPTLEPKLREMSEIDETRDSEFGLTKEEREHRRSSQVSSAKEEKLDATVTEPKFEPEAQVSDLSVDKEKEVQVRMTPDQ